MAIAIEIHSSFKKGESSGSNDSSGKNNNRINLLNKHSMTKNNSSITHSPHKDHIVPGHPQRYHTNNGTIIRFKDPYPRGGKH